MDFLDILKESVFYSKYGDRVMLINYGGKVDLVSNLPICEQSKVVDSLSKISNNWNNSGTKIEKILLSDTAINIYFILFLIIFFCTSTVVTVACMVLIAVIKARKNSMKRSCVPAKELKNLPDSAREKLLYLAETDREPITYNSIDILYWVNERIAVKNYRISQRKAAIVNQFSEMTEKSAGLPDKIIPTR